jgi:hypothetical protein
MGAGGVENWRVEWSRGEGVGEGRKVEVGAASHPRAGCGLAVHDRRRRRVRGVGVQGQHVCSGPFARWSGVGRARPDFLLSLLKAGWILLASVLLLALKLTSGNFLARFRV